MLNIEYLGFVVDLGNKPPTVREGELTMVLVLAQNFNRYRLKFWGANLPGGFEELKQAMASLRSVLTTGAILSSKRVAAPRKAWRKERIKERSERRMKRTELL
jgi:hypothetical protein